jgi:hypothetical protein
MKFVDINIGFFIIIAVEKKNEVDRVNKKNF